jgi:predicted enzyme related to lactoylglutathione lyase
MSKSPKRPKKRTSKRRVVRKRTTRNRAVRKSPSRPRHEPTRGLYGWITHTELASRDPIATREWCKKVLGWTFTQSVPMPGGEYQLFAYSEKGGGGIRPTTASESPHSTFTVHVADCQESFDKALREGAEPIMPPTRIMEGVTIATVRAPGGVQVGLSGP